MTILKCDDCEKLFTSDSIEIVEEWCGRMHRYIRICPYCSSPDFKEIDKLPYRDCDCYGECDLDCEHCNVARGQNHICQDAEDCTYCCDSCPTYQKILVN